jgi:branched-chain amino acid transport system ATP-binding protein
MLVLTNVDVSYGKIRVLDRVSLEVSAGSLVVLLGNNGAGKTTTINTISGLLKTTNGSIEFEGGRIERLSPDKRVKMGICQVPQGRQIFPDMTVGENLRLGALLRKDREKIHQDMESLFTYFPILRVRTSQYGGTLSGGEQQMLSIARALLGRPKLLLLDEPSLGLAPMLVDETFRIIEELHKKERITLFFVEQKAHMVLPIADFGYILQNGRIVTQGKPEDLLNDDSVRLSYLGH